MGVGGIDSGSMFNGWEGAIDISNKCADMSRKLSQNIVTVTSEKGFDAVG